MSKGRKMTVSDLIRESKPDWTPVRTRERRSSTRPYSGGVQVDAGDLSRSLDDQAEDFTRRNLDGDTGEDVDIIVEIDDSDR